MNKLISAAGLAVLLLLSCQKQEGAAGGGSGETPAGNTTISVDSDATKTSLSGKSVLWTANDAISVFDGVSNNCFTTLDSGASASFKGNATPSESYYLLYPYYEGASFDGGVISTTLPSEQTAVEGTFAPGANLSAAISESSDGTHTALMRNACCYMKFMVESAESCIKSVCVTGQNGEALSGDVEISFDTDGIPVISTLATTATGAACSAPGESVLAPGTYFIVMAPGSFDNGLLVTITMQDGSVRKYPFGGLKKTVRNSVYLISQYVDYNLEQITNEGVLDEVYPILHEGISDEVQFSEWSSWTNAASLRALLVKAANEGRTYYTDYKYYDYEQRNTLGGGKCTKYGNPLMYTCDLFRAVSSYYPADFVATVRDHQTRIINEAWKKNHSIPVLSWHLENPYADYVDFEGQNPATYRWTNENQTPERYVVRNILSNTEGKLDWLYERIDAVTEYLAGFKDQFGNNIPMILRLFHECEHSWGWWQVDYGREDICTREEFKQLFQTVVTRIRTTHPELQILFTYCTDRNFPASLESYESTYPGDEYVDIVAYDDYWIGRSAKTKTDTPRTKQEVIDDMLLLARNVSAFATNHNKIAVLFETNNYSEDPVEQREFFSEYIQRMLSDDNVHLSIVGTWVIDLQTPEREVAFAEWIAQPNVIFKR